MGIRNFPCNHWDRLPTSTGARRIPEPSTVTSHLESKMELSVWVLRPEAVKKNPSWKEKLYPPWNSYFWTKMDGYWLKDEISVFFSIFSSKKSSWLLAFLEIFQFTWSDPFRRKPQRPCDAPDNCNVNRRCLGDMKEGHGWLGWVEDFLVCFFVFFPDSFARQRCLIITNLTCTYSKLTSH